MNIPGREGSDNLLAKVGRNARAARDGQSAHAVDLGIPNPGDCERIILKRIGLDVLEAVRLDKKGESKFPKGDPILLAVRESGWRRQEGRPNSDAESRNRVEVVIEGRSRGRVNSCRRSGSAGTSARSRGVRGSPSKDVKGGGYRNRVFMKS